MASGGGSVGLVGRRVEVVGGTTVGGKGVIVVVVVVVNDIVITGMEGGVVINGD